MDAGSAAWIVVAKYLPSFCGAALFMLLRPPKTAFQFGLTLVSCMACGILGWPLLHDNIGMFEGRVALSQFAASGFGVAIAQATYRAINKVDVSALWRRD